MKTIVRSPRLLLRLVPKRARTSTPTARQLLQPLRAVSNPSLLVSGETVQVEGRSWELPKFLLLGKRGGGTPVRVGLLAGFEAEKTETVAAVAQLLEQGIAQPALAQDYALFAYPLINAPGHGPAARPHSALVQRWAAGSDDADGRYYRRELARWRFHLLLHLRSRTSEPALRAVTRSAVLGREVLSPVLKGLAASVPVAGEPVGLLPGGEEARLAEFQAGRLTPDPREPEPALEVALFAPASLPPDERAATLRMAVQGILAEYRRFAAYGGEL